MELNDSVYRTEWFVHIFDIICDKQVGDMQQMIIDFFHPDEIGELSLFKRENQDKLTWEWSTATCDGDSKR